MYNFQDQVKEIEKYFIDGEKDKECFRVGAEFEHFILSTSTLEAVSYYGSQGVESTLKRLLDKGWEGKYEGDYLVGLNREGTTITLEPGSQLEISIKADKKIVNIEREYIRFLEDIIPILKEKKQELMCLGYQPKSKIDEIKIIPKERYKYMFDYFKTRGKYAHNMMKGTASTQITIDYGSEEDFIKKFKVANVLSPVISALFDNSPYFEGEKYRKHLLRVDIWENCDSHRCGIVPLTMDGDFGYKKYAQYILNSPPIIILEDNHVSYTKDKLVKEIFNPNNYHIEELEHILTMVFPDVRLKKFIEIRMADSVPYPLNLSLIALIKGIMYDEENLQEVYNYVKDLKEKDIVEGKLYAIEDGLMANYIDRKVLDIGKWLLTMAFKGLSKEEEVYLKPLEDILSRGENPLSLTRDRGFLGKIG